MKAVVQRGYGVPEDVLHIDEIADPSPGGDEVLVRVRAAAINIGDSHMTKGVPKVMRPIFRKSLPSNRVPGTDIAGTVESVGADAAAFRPGDEVFGWCTGAFAEYIATPAGTLAAKPDNVSFEQAAATGVSAMTALQALRDHGGLQPGQHVLVVGASGGVGSFAVQIARALGAEVTGVCSTQNVDFVVALGADHVIDYQKDDFTQGRARYDLILDNAGKRSLAATRRALKPDGKLLSNGAPVSGWFGGLGHFARASIASVFVRRQARPFLSLPTADDLAQLRDLVAEEKVLPAVDRSFPLARAAEAMAHVGSGRARGKTVLTM